MSAEAVVTTLKSMKLHGMASAVAELADQGSPAFKQSGALLDKLIKAEVAEREVRSINYQMNVAKFPAHKDLAGFDFTESTVSEGQVKALHLCDFLDETENIVLIGDSAHTAHFSIGSGTNLALEDGIALADAIEHEDDLETALNI